MLTALLRTLVPAIYGYLLHLGLSDKIPEAWAVNLITVLVLAAIYLTLRELEAKWRWVGILLGAVGAPSYDAPAHDTVDKVQAATLDELHAALDRFGALVVGQVEARVHAALADQAVREGVAVKTALSKAAIATAAPKRPAPRKTAAKKPAPKST